MSTNHNRIKVADLETNQRNKILKTNQNGELEFSDVSDLQTENYNGLDYTEEGKALDARQGKVLKDMIENKIVNLATDEETQISTPVEEDNKVISRSKLFNWWEWIKSNAINLNNSLTLSPGTTETAPLTIPNGNLTSYPKNGAIERDENGNLHHTPFYTRERLLDTRDIAGFLTTTFNTSNTKTMFSVLDNVNRTTVSNITLPASALGSYSDANYLFKTFDKYQIKNNVIGGSIVPTSVSFEMHIKGLNCKFNGDDSFRLYSVNRTDINTVFSIRNYEIPINIAKANSNGNYYSLINYSELEFDNLGNITSESNREINVQTLDYFDSNGVGNMMLSDANIALEIRISTFFADSNNTNGENAMCNHVFSNYSSLFLKI
ncbi:hypothetical protein [Flavobacterium notoginsengisoli]|uniref:hypothetical protein n=1 Tax=Flavobacterium notoginsengisoli TaxID=1478199 RepID=UPI003639F040